MDATARTRRQRGPQAIAGGSARLRDSDGMDATARSRRLEHLRSYAASKDADQYDGAWTDDVKQGQGAMAFANGDRYDGSWNGDVRCGEGRCTFANGDTYDGHWHDDMRAGKGTAAFHNGETFSGDWFSDLQNGLGDAFRICPQRGNYTGPWKDGQMTGDGGVFAYANGDRYVGSFAEDLR